MCLDPSRVLAIFLQKRELAIGSPVHFFVLLEGTGNCKAWLYMHVAIDMLAPDGCLL